MYTVCVKKRNLYSEPYYIEFKRTYFELIPNISIYKIGFNIFTSNNCLITNKYDNIKISFFDIKEIYLEDYNLICIVFIEKNEKLYLFSNNAVKIKDTIFNHLVNFTIELNLYDYFTSKELEGQCCICFENNNYNIELPCCNKIIHFNCMVKYWMDNYKKNIIICPLCRNDFTTE